MAIEIVEGDLLSQEVDCIVNPWNRNIIPWWLLLPHGVSGAIKKRGGYKPFIELGLKGPIPLGGAVVTGAGRLPYKGIIHVAGIDIFWLSSEDAVRASVRNALMIAGQQKYSSIAFPLIGAGVGGGDKNRVIDVMVEEASAYNFKGTVRIVVFKNC